ncbi:Ribosomal RNA small subunit methyltransferase A [Candidatus Hodgkinia cicadicola]|nr:Ribosomal RNA small subunit methyltransferase A [Candidatus Hodgkinia cicadicola]
MRKQNIFRLGWKRIWRTASQCGCELSTLVSGLLIVFRREARYRTLSNYSSLGLGSCPMCLLFRLRPKPSVNSVCVYNTAFVGS